MIKIINIKNDENGGYFTVAYGEACARLGISRDTLYAYVSRGFVRAVAHPADARKSLYDRRDIEMLTARKQRGRSRRAVAASTIDWGEPVLSSKITRIADGRFFYRGRDAVELSRALTLEEALHLLARVRCRPDTPVPDSAATGGPRAARIARMAALCASSQDDDPALPIHGLRAHGRKIRLPPT